jgi:hypothetical protein
MYSSYSFTILALDGVSGEHYAPAVLYPRKGPPVPIILSELNTDKYFKIYRAFLAALIYFHVSFVIILEMLGWILER